MTFCQCSSKLCSILTFFGSSQRVARGGAKRPCKHERTFFLRKTCSQNEQSEKTNRTASHTLVPLVLPVPLVLLVLPASLVLHTTRPTYAHYLRSPVHRVSRAQLPAVCTVCHRMPFAHSQARKTRNTRKNGMG